MSQAKVFTETLSREFDALKREKDEGQEAVMRYFTPDGNVMRVGTLICDEGTNCIVIYGAQHSQTVVLPPHEAPYIILELVSESQAADIERLNQGERNAIGFR